MKIAIISDIHGNNIALEAMLRDLSKFEYNHIFILGDIVGYYYHPDKVLDLIKELKNPIIIQGNHEKILLAARYNHILKNQIKKKYGSGIDFALEKLSPNQIDFLGKLPEKLNLNIEGINFEICHGSPWDNDFYVYPDADEKIIDKCVVSKTNYVFLGHTHYPFIIKRGESVIINPGSVGQARTKGGIANWAFIDTDINEAFINSIYYDVSSIIEETKKNDPSHSYLHQILLRNRE